MAAVRLAWFAPMPPPDGRVPTDLSAAALPRLAADHDIDVFAGSADEARAWAAWDLPVHDAYDFVWRSQQRRYDLVVYQLSNEPRHDYVWGYLWHEPGLIVLQDVHLHHARARILLDGRETRIAHYAEELEYDHAVQPGVGGSLAAFTGNVLHVWPMRRAVIAAARTVAVHSEMLAGELRHEAPGADVAFIRPGVADPGVHASLRSSPGAREWRRRLSLPTEATVVAMFGPFTRSRRVSETIRAMAALRESDPGLHLLLVGPATGECDPLGEARTAGVLSRLRLTGAVAEAQMPEVLGAADIAICSRWPTAAETPAQWLTCLACGLPAIVTDVAHNADLPVLDPRTSTVHHSGRGAYAPEPIAVIVDLLDEVETLRLAMRRLSGDPSLRQLIGRAGRAWWATHHTPDAMADDYRAAIARAAARPEPDVAGPAHLRPDVFRHTRALLASIGARLPAELEPPAATPARTRQE